MNENIYDEINITSNIMKENTSKNFKQEISKKIKYRIEKYNSVIENNIDNIKELLSRCSCKIYTYYGLYGNLELNIEIDRNGKITLYHFGCRTYNCNEFNIVKHTQEKLEEYIISIILENDIEINL